MKYLKWQMAVCVCVLGEVAGLVIPQIYRAYGANILLGKGSGNCGL